MGAKWQCQSFVQGVFMPRQEETVKLDDTPEEPPYHRWKEQRSVARPLKENCQEVFSKESELVRMALQDYYNTHWPNYEMRVHMTFLLPSGTWLPLLTSWALRAMRYMRCGPARKTSGPLTTWPKHPPRTSASLGSCHPPNCPKSWAWGGSISLRTCNGGVGCPSVHGVEKKDRMRVQWYHLWTSHYHLGLVCSHCVEYFTTSTDTMHWHSQLCKPALPSISNDDNNDDQKKESVNDDNSGEYNDEFAFYED